jgi:hypothetical protein
MLAGQMDTLSIILAIGVLLVWIGVVFLMTGWWVKENIEKMGFLPMLIPPTSEEKRQALRILLTLSACSLFANIGFYAFAIIAFVVGKDMSAVLIGALLSIIAGVQVWRFTDSTRLPQDKKSETPTETSTP